MLQNKTFRFALNMDNLFGLDKIHKLVKVEILRSKGKLDFTKGWPTLGTRKFLFKGWSTLGHCDSIFYIY